MRLMSFAATTEQMHEGTKTVTRRIDRKGWWAKVLTPGTLVCACEKTQGIPKGGPIKRIGVIEIVNVRREPLYQEMPAGNWEPPRELALPALAAEGFRGDWFCWSQFVHLFCEVNGVPIEPPPEVTRIEFKHRLDLSPCCGVELARSETHETYEVDSVCTECGGIVE